MTYKSDRIAGSFRPAGPADPMNIILRISRHVIVKHMRNTLNVDTSRCNISRNHHLVFTAFKPIHSPLTLLLRTVRMNRFGFNFVLFQRAAYLVRSAFSTRKDQNAVHLLTFHHIKQKLHLLVLPNRINMLSDRIDRIMLLTDLEHLRRTLYMFRKFLNSLRHRRRKKQRLPILRDYVDDLLDIVHKTHIKHTVSFVKNKNLNTRQVNGPAIKMIDQPPRSSRHNIHTPA